MISRFPGKPQRGLMMWQAEVEGKDGITYIDAQSGKEIGRLQFEDRADRHYALLMEGTGKNIKIDLELRHSDRTRQQIYRALGEAAKAALNELGSVPAAAGSAAIDNLIGVLP